MLLLLLDLLLRLLGENAGVAEEEKLGEERPEGRSDLEGDDLTNDFLADVPYVAVVVVAELSVVSVECGRGGLAKGLTT